MKTRWLTSTLFGLLLLILATSPANALEIFLNDPAATYLGSWTYANTGTVATYSVRGDEHYTFGASDTATWTPGVTGLYEVQAHWYTYPSHSPQARYTVNYAGGSTAINVNQQQTASQGQAGSLTGYDMGSGWYTLGQFPLNGSSTIVLSNAAGTGALSADALRISDVGTIVDEFSAKTTYSPTDFYFPRAYATNTVDQSTEYTHRWGGTDTATYAPGVTGLARVRLSWPTNAGHATQARYRITDADGAIHDITVDQRMYADQMSSPASGSAWSGWYNAGYYKLGPSSTIVLNNLGSGAMAVDAVFVDSRLAYSGYPGQVVYSDAVGYWRLNEANGATKAINLGSAGPVLNGDYNPAKVSVPGLIMSQPADSAADFNGSTSFVKGTGLNTAGPGGRNVFAGDWTIEAWFVRDSVTSSAAIFSNNVGTNNSPIMTFGTGSTSHRLGLMATGTTWDGFLSTDLAQLGGPNSDLGKRIYAVITKTGGNTAGTNTISIYANVDGVWLAPVTGSTTWNLVNGDGFYLGRHYDYGGYFDGRIDDVAVYSRTLNWLEIQSHYEASLPEPSTFALLFLGFTGLLGCGWRRRRG